ncbi:MAG: proteinase inhibitor [Myxococcales bacterium]|nr:proteinase inhibitor [Myxococcales bacterium]
MHHTARLIPWAACILLGAAACDDGDASSAADGGASPPPVDGGVAPPDDAAPPPSADAAPPSDSGAAPAGFEGRCVYENPFSRTPECREYRGPGWDAAAAAADCEAVFLGRPGTFSADGPCALDDEIGRCLVGQVGQAGGYEIVFSGDAEACGAAQSGCETFAGGTFAPGAACDSCAPAAEVAGQPFVPAYTDCRPAAAGEPPGATDGEVCTPTIISGSTEPGRRYADYADCDVVRTQRPYYPRAPEAPGTEGDPRLDDADYMGELAWVKQQAEASACACCHTASDTPMGAAVWDTEAGPLWIDTVSDEALAMLGGYTDSAAFGFLPAGENNGFDRSTTGLPTTDVERLRAFVERELARRDVTVAEARELPPFAPIFRELIEFEPEPCAAGQGMDADGTLRWTGGGARYLYVLEADAQAPGVPPNWDLPEGTLWSITVPPTALEMGCGMAYGQPPADAVQRVPAAGAPPPLRSGETYFLYVLRDIAQPITRCLFTAP